MHGQTIRGGFRKLALPQAPEGARASMFTRSFEAIEQIRAAEGTEERPRYRMSVSSEYKVRRWFGYEVLSHKRSAIDLSRAKSGLAVRDGHFGDQVGLASDWEVTDAARLQCEARFSSNPRPQEIERDVADGIRRNVSLHYTYDLKALRLLEQGKDGEPNTYLITRWQPVHVAFEPDPADPTVGVGRSAGEVDETFDFSTINGGETAEEGRSMCTKCKQPTCTGTCETQSAAAVTPTPASGGGSRSAEAAGAPAPALAPASTATIEVGATRAAEARNLEVAEIVRTCQAHGQGDRAAEFIESRMSAGDVARELLKGKRTNGAAAPPAEQPGAGLPAKDRKRFSYARAILAGGDPDKLTGLEKEMHQDIRSKLPTSYRDNGGVYVPLSLEGDNVGAEERLSRALDAFMAQNRALDSKTATAAAELVMDQYGGLIPLLRKNAVVIESGARVLNGLTAPIAFTKQTGAGTASWVGENPGSDLADSALATGIQTLSPKTLQSTTSFSRQLLVLANEDVERMVREDLATIHALAIDKAAYYGIGSSAQPQGIYQAPDVIAKAMGGGADWAKIVDMVAQCADANALDGTLGWIAQTLLAGRYMTIPRVASAAAGFLWEGSIKNGVMAGYPARATSQLSKVMSGSEETGGSSYGLIFGNWADLIIGMWGALEMIPDPYSKKKQGLIELTTFQMTDVMLRHGESFVKATGATLA